MESKINDRDPPMGWKFPKLGEILSFEYGKALPENRRHPSGEVPVFGSSGVVGHHTEALTEKECLVVGRKGSVGSVYLSQVPCWPIDTTYFIYPPLGLDLKFLYFCFSFLNMASLDRSTAIPGLNRNDAYSLIFPLPPHTEQIRIVARIEELFSHLDAGVLALQRAKAQLQRYRQAVLKAAVEGRLTEGWRKAHPVVEPAEKLLKRIRSKELNIRNPVSDLPDLPKEWIWANLGEIGNVSGGLTKNSKRNNYPLKMPYLRVANVYAGELRLDEVKEIGLGENELDRVLLNPGDLLVVEGNGSSDQIGRVALWDGRISPCVHQNHIIKIRFNPTGIGKFVLYWLLSISGREQINKVASSTSGLYTLSISKVASLLAPLPPFLEQEKIVDEIEYRLSIVDKEHNIIDKNILITDYIRQSILKRAFDGRLIPQDPNDEPASILLERIVKTEKRVIPSRRVERRIKNAMSKVGFKGNDLYKLLLSSNRSLTPRELWKLSNLTIEEFYSFLRKEIESGRISEDKINNKLIAKAEIK